MSMVTNQNMFIGELRKQNRCKHPLVLDLGCGSGRDSTRFIQEGFAMHCLDISAKSIQETFDRITRAEDGRLLPVTFSVMDMREMHHYYKFDGVWANASLLRLNESEISEMIRKIYLSLLPDGIFFFSFKEGKGTVDDNGTITTYMTKKHIEKLMSNYPFTLLEFWQNKEYRENSPVIHWLNFIYQKKD